MKRIFAVLFPLSLMLAVPAVGQFALDNPFKSQAELVDAGGQEQLQVRIAVPEGHYLYKADVTVEAVAPEGVALRPLPGPAAKRKYDEGRGMEVEVFAHDVMLPYEVTGRGQAPLKVRLSYQGCSSSVCFPPEDVEFSLSEVARSVAGAVVAEEADVNRADLDELLARFEVGGQGEGYMAPDDFLKFLGDAKAGRVAKEEDRIVQRVFRKYGLVAVLLLLIPLGFMLNLTPCVLPMIPINLAIIGAGAQGGSRRRGFALGSAYGAGMAAVYGALGLVVVLTGQTFGALNSSPWFSLAIAIVFTGLALAMFDVYMIDLSRFQRHSGGGGGSASFATAFLLGGTAALLAGACVAPVLISVLVLAANLYRTNPAALLLPFMLGVGMALPWPFAGAGLSFLPKPGGWMDWVKRVFGVLILGMALYYGVQAVRQFRQGTGGAGHLETDVAAALREGLREDKPVFLDFWAISCSACRKMERHVFPEPAVAKELEGFVFAGVQSDLADRDDVRWAMQTFGVRGNPTYVVLVPKTAAGK